MKATPNKSTSKPRNLSSTRDLSPSLMDWCKSKDGQVAMSKLKSKQSHTTSEDSPVNTHEASGTQLSIF